MSQDNQTQTINLNHEQVNAVMLEEILGKMSRRPGIEMAIKSMKELREKLQTNIDTYNQTHTEPNVVFTHRLALLDENIKQAESFIAAFSDDLLEHFVTVV